MPTEPPELPTPTPIAFVPVGELLKSGLPNGEQVSTAGYIVANNDGAFLTAELSLAIDGVRRLPASSAEQIWLGSSVDPALGQALRAAGNLRYAIVLARGRLEGPGAYGSGGRYRYQLAAPKIEPLAVQETTIAQLLDNSASYENRVVRVVGGLLTRDTATLLVDRLGAGGLPEPKARQVKLRGPLDDRELLNRMHSASGGAIRFGQVQVEGFWRGGVLIPLSIMLIT